MRPGLFFNIFGGIVVVVIMGYTLVAEATGLPAGQSFYHFLQWFFMIYTSCSGWPWWPGPLRSRSRRSGLRS